MTLPFSLFFAYALAASGNACEVVVVASEPETITKELWCDDHLVTKEATALRRPDKPIVRTFGRALLAMSWPVIFLVGLSALISWLFGPTLWQAAVILNVLFIGSWFATEGEYMPGQVDNPDGDLVHPGWLLLGLFGLLLLLLLIGHWFPEATFFGLAT